MAFSCATGNFFANNTPTTPYNAQMRFQGNSYSGNIYNSVDKWTNWGSGWDYDGWDGDYPPSGSWSKNTGSNLNADYFYSGQAKADNSVETKYGSSKNRKTNAMVATTQTPTHSGVTAESADIACYYTPNVNASSCSAQLQYKRTVDSTWINAGAAQGTGGYTQIQISRSLSGLSPETQYDVRLVITRTTNNDTSLTSSTHSFTTLPGTPTATTNAATDVNAGVSGTPDDGHATLNGDVDRNTQTDAEWRFGYDTVSRAGGAYTYNTAWTATTSEPETVQKAISSLSESTTYYFRLEVRWNSGTEFVYGSELTFAVPADPGVEAAQESHVDTLVFFRKYKVICDSSTGQPKIPLSVRDVASNSSDRLLTTASPFAAGDVKISKDGGAFANTTNLPVQVTASFPGRTLQLEASELDCGIAHIIIRDQDGPAFRDMEIYVITELLLGNAEVNAADGAKADTTALLLKGYGAGHGLSAVGGATGKDIDGVMGSMILRKGTAQAGAAASITLDSGAVATADYYNGSIVMIVGGTGVGQARVIVDYSAARVATVDYSWAVNPDATSVYILIPGPRVWQMYRDELSGIPADNASYGDKFQLVYQRFAYKIDQTATVQQLYKKDNTTVLGSRSVSDASGTQTVAKLA